VKIQDKFRQMKNDAEIILNRPEVKAIMEGK
jgi:hypothetical protein